MRRAVRTSRTVEELKERVPSELLFDYAIHVRRCALTRSKLRRYLSSCALEVSALDKQLGISEDLQMVYLARTLDAIESSAVDRRLQQIIFESHPSRTYGLSGGAFSKVVDFQRISQEFGNVASYCARREGFLEESRREKFVDYVNRRHRIIRRHIAGLHATIERKAHVHYFIVYLYRLMEAVFYYHSPSYWHFFERYGLARFLVFDLHILLSALAMCFYLGYFHLSLCEFLFFHSQTGVFLDSFFKFLTWRSHFLFGEAFYSRFFFTPFLLCYPTFAIPYLLTIALLPQPPNYYFGKNLVPYWGKFLLVISLFNFFSVFAVVGCQYLAAPLELSAVPRTCELDSFFYRLDYFFSFFVRFLGEFWDGTP